jgi:hypothetical protein
MSLLAPPPTAATRPQPLPHASTAAPVVVHLESSKYPVTVAYATLNAWTISETFGPEHVIHGHLLKGQNGRFAVLSVGQTDEYGYSWQEALTTHLGRQH